MVCVSLALNSHISLSLASMAGSKLLDILYVRRREQLITSKRDGLEKFHDGGGEKTSFLQSASKRTAAEQLLLV